MADDFDGFDAPAESGGSGGGSATFNASSLSAGAKAFIKQFMPDDDDSGCIATFYMENEFQTFESKKQSDEKGEPVEIFKPVLCIAIDVKGSNLNSARRPATEADKKRFPFSWQEFKKGESARQHGAPLNKLGLDAQTIREYGSMNVFTIEDLSQVSDNNLQRMGVGSREWRLRAKEYLGQNRATSEQQQAIAAQADQIAQLKAMVEKLTEEKQKVAEPAPSKTLSLKGKE